MKKCVYIVDDDEDVRDVLTYALTTNDYDTKGFENGKVALEALTKLRPEEYPDMMIVDFMMPKLDGLAFLHILKERYADSLGTIPLAFSTARGSFEKEIVIPDYVEQLEKPMDLDKLLEVVERLTEKKAELTSRV